MKSDSLCNEKNKCCGCMLCANECPKGAITFKKDELGFLYPIINEEKCINCSKCERVCPMRSFKNKLSHIGAYAAVNRNDEQLLKSASGGVFSALAEVVLDEGGTVYGSTMCRDDSDILKIKHIRISEKKDITSL